MNLTPITRCIFRRNNAVFFSASAVFEAFSTVATSPSMIIQGLASKCVVVLIVGGSTLCVISSCKLTLGSTRLTKIFLVSSFSFLLGSVCVAIVDVCVSVWVPRVSFRLVSVCLLTIVVVFPEVVLLWNFVIVPCFFVDSSSLASWTDDVETMGDFRHGVFICSMFIFFLWLGVACGIVGPMNLAIVLFIHFFPVALFVLVLGEKTSLESFCFFFAAHLVFFDCEC